MDRAEVDAALRRIVVKNSALPIRSIAAEDSLTADLGFDSLALLTTLGDLEEQFGVPFPVEEVDELQNLRFADLVGFVERRLAGREA